jgi:hypothetical protein
MTPHDDGERTWSFLALQSHHKSIGVQRCAQLSLQRLELERFDACAWVQAADRQAHVDPHTHKYT